MGAKEAPLEVSDEAFNDLIRDQYLDLESSLILDIEEEAKYALIPQSIQGRAQFGHGPYFKGTSRPNITMPEVYSAIGFDPVMMRAGRQNILEETLHCFDDLLDGKKSKFTDRRGGPLFGVKTNADYTLDVAKELFQGAAMFGRVDTSYWREETKRRYPLNLSNKPLKLGHGEEMPVSLNRLGDFNMNLLSLSEKPHDAESRAKMREYGIIVDEEKLKFDGFENAFVRYAQGCGICDDATLISVGLFYGESAMRAGFNIDAADTYTKFCANRVAGGFDEHIGAHIEKRWKEMYNEDLLTPEETTRIIYLGAKNTLKASCFSSSHRRLVEHERTPIKDPNGNIESYSVQDKPTFLNHIGFVSSGHEERFELGFDRYPSNKFYANLRTRFEKTGNSKLLPPRQKSQSK